MYTVVVLFHGVGGFSLGFHQAGFKVILAVDNWVIAHCSHRANFPHCVHLLKDCLKLDEIPECDVLIGSPPCKSFSSASNFLGKKDSRDVPLVDKFLELTEYAKLWVMENVQGVKCSHLFPYMPHILNAYDFGIKQWRRRAFFANFSLPRSPNGGKIRLNPDAYNTIIASEYKKTIENNGNFTKWFILKHGRKPSVDDIKEHMGFPEDFIVFGNKSEKIRQLGDAVVPQVAYAIALNAKKVLNED